MCDPNPISIILISSGSRGDRLLFKYPFETEDIKESLKQGEAYILSNIQIIDRSSPFQHLHKISILLLYLSFILVSLYFIIQLLFCSRPRALAARVYFVK